jgi:transposase
VGVPVLASQALYGNFKHVYGVPQENGVSIDRIKVLDSLIERLASLKRDPAFAARERTASRGLSNGRLDALIEQYGKELRSALATPLASSYASAPLQAAMVFDLVA